MSDELYDEADAPASTPTDSASEEQPEPLYNSAYEFFTDYVAPAYARKWRGDRIWCDQWWRHPEAVVRISACWQAFEAARCDAPEALSSFWLLHLDPHMSQLSDPSGPFVDCRMSHLGESTLMVQPPATTPGWDEFT
ncbi:DUF4913 domain-containing protein [Tomitella gaofuii]|uniref:DUF4913 domain-containing protein n=1 Tax=Tomitella gaofuii TaxID=2760083 RepID=UPI0015FC9796|nr:DUF4913 domain-containing protein [Tomitella gaofuii]